MNSTGVQDLLFVMARGAIGQANIDARELNAISLPVPPVELQCRDVEAAEAACAVAHVLESNTRTGTAASASLLHFLLEDGEHLH